MFWFLLCAAAGSTVVALLWIAWRKWVAPWRQAEQLVRQIASGGHPRTFLVDGGAEPKRLGLALESIFTLQQELNKQIAGRESGTRAILGAMQDGLLVVDASERVTLVNQAFRKLFNLPEVSLGAPLLDVVRDATLDRLIADTLSAGTAMQAELILPYSQTNAERHVEISAVPMKDNRGKISGAVILFHDITELRRVDQMRSDFVANVSHELRTPLSILRGYIETLLDDPKISRDESSRILEVMERHSKRLGLLVDDLLTLAQLESASANLPTSPDLQLSDVRISRLFGDVVRDWEKKLAEKQLKVVVDLPAEVPIVHGNETRLQEILYNLLDNAVKYSPRNGEIRLRAEQRGREIALSVSDRGAGISREDLPRIFERFYRVDKARSRELGGTGLGLSIVKHIAQLHGGRVEAESELEKGTTVRVLLPLQRSNVDTSVTQT